MNKKSLLGISMNIFLLVISSLIVFVQNKYFIQYIGIAELGLVSLFYQILAYMLILEAGLATAAASSLYKPLAEKNNKRVAEVMYTVRKFYKRIVLLMLLCGIAFSVFLPFFLHDIEMNIWILIYWLIYLVGGSLSYLKMQYVVLMNADQKFNTVNLVTGINLILTRILQLVIIVIFHSLLFFILATLIQVAFDYIFFKYYFTKYYKNINELIKVSQPTDKSVKNLVKNLFWHRTAAAVINSTSLILISLFVSLAQAGLYASYMLVITFFNQVTVAIAKVLTPIIGKFAATHEKDIIYIRYKTMQILFLYISSTTLLTT